MPIKVKRKVMSFVLMVVFLVSILVFSALPVYAATDTPVVTSDITDILVVDEGSDEYSVETGTQIDVYVDFDDNATALQFGFYLAFDASKLSFSGAHIGTQVTNTNMEGSYAACELLPASPPTTPYAGIVYVKSEAKPIYASGHMVTIRFNVKGTLTDIDDVLPFYTIGGAGSAAAADLLIGGSHVNTGILYTGTSMMFPPPDEIILAKSDNHTITFTPQVDDTIEITNCKGEEITNYGIIDLLADDLIPADGTFPSAIKWVGMNTTATTYTIETFNLATMTGTVVLDGDTADSTYPSYDGGDLAPGLYRVTVNKAGSTGDPKVVIFAVEPHPTTPILVELLPVPGTDNKIREPGQDIEFKVVLKNVSKITGISTGNIAISLNPLLVNVNSLTSNLGSQFSIAAYDGSNLVITFNNTNPDSFHGNLFGDSNGDCEVGTIKFTLFDDEDLTGNAVFAVSEVAGDVGFTKPLIGNPYPYHSGDWGGEWDVAFTNTTKTITYTIKPGDSVAPTVTPSGTNRTNTNFTNVASVPMTFNVKDTAQVDATATDIKLIKVKTDNVAPADVAAFDTATKLYDVADEGATPGNYLATGKDITFNVTDNFTYYILAVDRADNFSITPVVINFFDRVLPVITQVKVTPTGNVSPKVISATIKDDHSGIATVQLFKTSDTGETSPVAMTVDATITSLYKSANITANDEYYIKVVDKAGNPKTYPAIVVDGIASPPTLTLTPSPASGAGSVTITATVTGLANNVDISRLKYVKGDRTTAADLTAFDTGVIGTTLDFNAGVYTFTVSELCTDQVYTVFLKDTAGNMVPETVTVTVTQAQELTPPILLGVADATEAGTIANYAVIPLQASIKKVFKVNKLWLAYDDTDATAFDYLLQIGASAADPAVAYDDASFEGITSKALVTKTKGTYVVRVLKKSKTDTDWDTAIIERVSATIILEDYNDVDATKDINSPAYHYTRDRTLLLYYFNGLADINDATIYTGGVYGGDVTGELVVDTLDLDKITQRVAGLMLPQNFPINLP